MRGCDILAVHTAPDPAKRLDQLLLEVICRTPEETSFATLEEPLPALRAGGGSCLGQRTWGGKILELMGRASRLAFLGAVLRDGRLDGRRRASDDDEGLCAPIRAVAGHGGSRGSASKRADRASQD